MFSRLVFLVSFFVSAARAQSATIFPVALGPDANLHGEIIGSSGELETTFLLSGATDGVTFTLTLAEDATRVSERVSIPTRSYDLSIECNVSAGSAICENVVVSHGVTSTLEPTTLPFSPFPIPVSTSGAIQGSGTASGSASFSAIDSSLTEGPSITTGASSVASTSSALPSSAMTGISSAHTSALSIAPSAPIPVTSAPHSIASIPSALSAVSSGITHQSSNTVSGIRASSSAISPTSSVATLASSSASQVSTSGASKPSSVSSALVLLLVAVFSVLG